MGWRGLPLHTFNGADSGFRRTIGIYPRLRVSAGLIFAVILLSKAMDVGRDHLIHRKRSPFPEKTEWRVKSGEWSWRSLREHDWQYWALASIETSSTADAVPLPRKDRVEIKALDKGILAFLIERFCFC